MGYRGYVTRLLLVREVTWGAVDMRTTEPLAVHDLSHLELTLLLKS
jgi:hypothetical protein